MPKRGRSNIGVKSKKAKIQASRRENESEEVKNNRLVYMAESSRKAIVNESQSARNSR